MKGLVYTAVFGGSDMIRNPIVIEKDVDYMVYSDKHVIASADGWNRAMLDKAPGDPRMKARRVKIGMPLSPVAKIYDWTMWVDGSHLPKVRITDLVEEWLKKHSFAGWLHHAWQCTYTEIRRCGELKKESMEKLAIALKEIRESGFPEEYGQMATPVVIRRQCDEVKQHAEMWLDCVEHLSIRDQISYLWCGWRLWKKPMMGWINVLGPSAFHNEVMAYAGGH